MSKMHYDVMRQLLTQIDQPIRDASEVEYLRKAISERNVDATGDAIRNCLNNRIFPSGFLRRLLEQHGLDTPTLMNLIPLATIAKHKQGQMTQINGSSLTATGKGVGDHLHDVIRERTGMRPTAKCGCQSMRKKMNSWGVVGCRKHMEEIVQHMLGQRKRLLPWQRWLLALPGGQMVARTKAREMVEEAINRTEHSANTEQPSDHGQ